VPHRIDIVVPVFNEPENTRAFYGSLIKLVRSDWRLLIVYDFDADTTLPVARELLNNDERITLVRNDGRGALSALKAGFRAATCEAVCAAMVDDPESIIGAFDELLADFYEQEATVAVASRYMPGGSHTGGPWLKGLLSRTAGLSLHYLIFLPTHDATYNTRIYRKSFLDAITIESTQGFEVALEIIIKAHLAGRTIIEHPVHWAEREVGVSRFKLMKWIVAYSYWYLYGITHYWLPSLFSSPLTKNN
jgi:Glycosyltransferases involved in cell wall biogenesis